MKHSDLKADKALVKKMVKQESLTGKKSGGPLKKAGGGSVARGMGAAKKGGDYKIC